MIELKAVVIDKPQGRRRIRYMARMEGSRTFVTRELNPKVKFDKKNVINRIAHDFAIKETEIKFDEFLLKEHKLDKKTISEMIKIGGGIRRRHARNKG